MKLFRYSVGMLLAAVALLALGACGPAEKAAPTATTGPQPVATPTAAPAATPTAVVAAPKYGGILTTALRQDPPGWDAMQTTLNELVLIQAALNGDGNLTKPCRENTYEICPGLAKSWERNADSTVWTFTIRDGVVWHDGTPFTAQDAKFWLDLSLKGTPSGRPAAKYAANLGPIDKVEVVDGNKVRITLSEPRGALPFMLPSGTGAMDTHPRHLFQPEIDKGNFNVAPNEVGYVGTGPFKMLKYDKGVVVQVRRFDKYWEKDAQSRQLPYLDGIDYVVMKEPSAMFAAFRTGRLDRSTNGARHYWSPQLRETARQELGDKVVFVKIPPFGRLIGVNARKAPYNDVRVRQAISLYLDRPSYFKAIHDGDGEVSAVFLPTSPYTNPDFLDWPGWSAKTKEQDRAKAKELLKEAGYPNGFKISILTGENWVAYSEWLKGQLDGLVGAQNVSLATFDTATYFNKICEAAFDLINPLDSGVFARNLPEPLAAGYITTNKCSYVQHDDKKVDEYFTRIARTAEEAERVRLARELERYMSIEQWLAFNVGLEVNWLALRSYVKGWPAPAWGTTNNGDFATTWMDK